METVRHPLTDEVISEYWPGADASDIRRQFDTLVAKCAAKPYRGHWGASSASGLTALQAAAAAMAERYSEMLARNGMHAEHSPTVRAVVDALNDELNALPPADCARTAVDAATIIRDLIYATEGVAGDDAYQGAVVRAEAYLEALA